MIVSLPFYENALDGGYLQSPNDYFRDLQQAAINGLFDCTSAKYTIKEQDTIGSPTYHCVDVWLDYIVGTTSSGVKNGIDFTQLMFRDIDHKTVQGLYYIFDDNFHISYFYNHYDGLEKAVAVRKCNNVMRIVDPENGAIFSIPCVIDYDMTSPSQQVSSYIITPNNHAIVMVQGNDDTLRLFKLNTRFMFNGRPFKLLAYQNTLNQDLFNQKPTLLYLDLYLDELHDKDDIENGIAYNGDFVYSIAIDSTNMALSQGSTGKLSATVLCNGEEVNSPVIWKSSDEKVVTIDNDGNYNVVGEIGANATIVANLQHNDKVNDSVEITVVDNDSVQPSVVLEPSFNKIRQYETIDFVVKVLYGTEEIVSPTNVQLSLSPDNVVLFNQYLTISQKENQYVIVANKIALEPQILYITVQNDAPSFRITQAFTLNVVSMFG